MEDIDDADADGDGDGDVDMDDDDGDDDGDNDGEDDDGDGDGDDNNDDDQGENDEDDQAELESPSLNRLHARSSSRPVIVPQPNGIATPTKSVMPKSLGDDVHTPKIGSLKTSRPTTTSITYNVVLRPQLRPEAITAATYDIAPTIAAPQSTSINVVTATPDMHWVFTGGSDGYIRKFNWLDTVNAKLMLTVAQRHPFVDSVTKAGVLTSYWENENPTSKLL
jgi:transcriptional activator SPT8